MAVVLVLAGAAHGALASTHHASDRLISWPTYGLNLQATGFNRLEATLGPTKARGLHQAWKRHLGGLMIAQPVEAANVLVHGERKSLIYEGTENGIMDALSATSGKIVWQQNLGAETNRCSDLYQHSYGIGSTGAISFSGRGRGVIYVAGGDGAVHALNLATGAEQRHWPIHAWPRSQVTVYSGVTVSRGKLYVATAGYCDAPPYHGGLVEIDLAKHAVTHRFYPAGPPSAGISGGGVWGPASVSIDPSDGHLFAATGNSEGPGTTENYRYSESVVDLTPSLRVTDAVKPSLTGPDVDFGSTPVLFHPTGCRTTLVAAKNKSGVLVVYPAENLTGQPSQRLQMANLAGWTFNGVPAWDPVTNMLYVTSPSNSSDGVYQHGLVALRAGRNCSLSLAWQHEVSTDARSFSPPTVADGVVYFGNGYGDTVFAYDAKTGKRLWSTTTSGGIFAAPTVVNGRLLFASWNGTVYAFSP